MTDTQQHPVRGTIEMNCLTRDRARSDPGGAVLLCESCEGQMKLAAKLGLQRQGSFLIGMIAHCEVRMRLRDGSQGEG